MMLSLGLSGLLGTFLWGSPGSGSVRTGVLYQQGESPEEQVAVRISLEEVDAHLNSLFTTPVHLETLSEVQLRSLTVQLSYPPEFSFEKAHPGYQLSADQFDIQSRTEEGADGLKVTTISIQAEETLPGGLILYLDFRVGEKVENRMITLQNRIVRAVTAGGEALPANRLSAEELEVYVLRSDMLPVVACFFYMH